MLDNLVYRISLFLAPWHITAASIDLLFRPPDLNGYRAATGAQGGLSRFIHFRQGMDLWVGRFGYVVQTMIFAPEFPLLVGACIVDRALLSMFTYVCRTAHSANRGPVLRIDTGQGVTRFFFRARFTSQAQTLVFCPPFLKDLIHSFDTVDLGHGPGTCPGNMNFGISADGAKRGPVFHVDFV